MREVRLWDEEERRRANYVDDLVRHADVLKELGSLQRRAQTVRWWQLAEQLDLRRALRRTEDDLARVSAQIDDPELRRTIVAALIGRAVSQARQHSHRNTFHPEVLDELDRVVAAARSSLERTTPAAAGGFQGMTTHRKDVFVTQLPALAELLDEAAIRAYSVDTVEALARIASDEEMLTWVGDDQCVVQHRASGLRQHFWADRVPVPGRIGVFGATNARTYKVASLVDEPDPGPWECFVGLGIGTRLYRAGAELMPGVRWWSSVAKAPAVAVRRRLHAEDPYIWHWSECTWCYEQTPEGWAGLPREAFAQHP
ncbi:hypothetical protein SAMN05421867_12156 [Cellulomonas marina]|uniref:Uncharacterized protein n=1 Tax=Cellulomonas marina TaxID=988821 RepID=A0A1I1AQW3_9CELL|nr:hypothetical protein SAMN05421867_12156 [Cellulomonas marina]